MKIDLNKLNLLKAEEIGVTDDQFLPYFIPLQPAGYRSGDVEAMSSYICRQAEIVMEWSHIYGQRLLDNFVTSQSLPACRKNSAEVLRLCNSIGVISSRYIEALSNASEGNINAQLLTLHPLRFLCEDNARGLHKQYMEWCPECWRLDREAEESPYVRLYWLVESTKICVIHNHRLSTYCPACGEVKLQFPKFPRQWICDKCGEDLSKPDEKHVPDSFTTKDAWVSNAIYRLIERVYSDELALDQFIVAKAIRRLIYGSKLSLTEFCHKLNIESKSIKNMLDPKRRPYFLAFLDLCYRLDLPPDQFLFDKDILTTTELWRTLPKPAFTSKVNLDHKKKSFIHNELLKLISDNPKPPIRVSHIAKKYEISHSILQYNFPNEYKELRKRWTQWERDYRRRNHTARLEHFVNAVFSLTRHDIYPSERKLRDLELVVPSDLRREDVKCLLRAFQEIYSDLQFY